MGLSGVTVERPSSTGPYADERLIGDQHQITNQLGFRLQATTVRYMGVFLYDRLSPLACDEYPSCRNLHRLDCAPIGITSSR